MKTNKLTNADSKKVIKAILNARENRTLGFYATLKKAAAATKK